MPGTMSTSDDEEFYDPPSSPLSDPDSPALGGARGERRGSPAPLTPDAASKPPLNGHDSDSDPSGDDRRIKTSDVNNDVFASCSDNDDATIGNTGEHCTEDNPQEDFTPRDGAASPIELVRKGSDGESSSDVAGMNLTENSDNICDVTATSDGSQSCDLMSQVAVSVSRESMAMENIENNTTNAGESPNVATDQQLAAVDDDDTESKSPGISSPDPVLRIHGNIEPHPLSDPEAEADLDALVQMQGRHDITSTSSIDLLANNLSYYSKSGTDDDTTAPLSELHSNRGDTSCDDTCASPGNDEHLVAEDTKTRPHTLSGSTCTPPENSDSVSGQPTDTQTCINSDNHPSLNSEHATIADTRDIAEVFTSDTIECPQEVVSIGLCRHAESNNKDFDSTKSSTCGLLESDSNDKYEQKKSIPSVCHNQLSNHDISSENTVGLEGSTPKYGSDQNTMFQEMSTSNTTELEVEDNTHKTDYNANVKIAEVQPTASENEDALPTDFLVKMAALGTRSKSVDRLPETSSVTLGSLSPTSGDTKQPSLQRRETFPFASSPTENSEQRRSVTVVRMASVDAKSTESKASPVSKPSPTHSPTRRRSRTDPNADKSAPTKESISAVRKSLQLEGGSKTSDKTQTDKAESTYRDMTESIDSKTVLKLLDNLERHLEHEKKLRERAEDWADFLTSELEAHIDARTASEKRYTTMRERFIAYKEKMVAKYKRLVGDHKALVIQIKELTLDDGKSSEEKSSPKPNSSTAIMRRKPSQTDRNAMLTKRNAMLIRGSRREPSSDEDDASDSGESQGHNNRTSAEKLPSSIADVKVDWQKSLQERRAAAKKSENAPERKSPLKVESSPVKPTQTSPVKASVSPAKLDNSPAKLKASPEKVESSPKSVDSTSPKSPFIRQGSLRLSFQSNARRSSSTSQSNHEIKPETAKVVSSTPPDKSKSTPEKLKVSSAHPDKTSTPLTNGARSKKSSPNKVNGKDSDPDAEEKEDGPVDVRAFTNMWEKKIAKVPFEAQTATPRLSLRTSERSSSFSSIPASPVSPIEPKRPSSRQNGDDTFELDDDDELEYLSAQEDDFDESTFKKSEGVMSESINTKAARSMFQNIANASMNTNTTPKAEPPKMKLSYSASTREARTKFMAKTDSVDGASARTTQRTRPRAKTLTEGIPNMDSVDTTSHNGSASNSSGGAERSAKFSTLMSRWQQK